MQDHQYQAFNLAGTSLAIPVQQPSQPSHAIHGYLGGLAGLLMDTVLHPIDTVRTRIKTNTQESVALLSQIKHMYRHEGLSSYLRGLTCTLGGSFVANGAYFFAYEKLKNVFIQRETFNEGVAPFVAAFTGGVIANILYLPFIVVRTRMQTASGFYDYRNAFDGLKKVIKYEGFRSLYLGGPIFLTQTALDLSLTFGFYEFFHKTLKAVFQSESDSSLPITMASSVMAASLSAVIANPLDVLVARMQTMHTSAHGKCTIPAMVKRIYAKEGLAGFMKGVTGTMSHYSMAALILFPTYQKLKDLYDVDSDL